MSDSLTILAKPNGKSPPDVRAMLGDELIHRDQIHPAKQEHRKRFAKAVNTKLPAISVDAVDSQLLIAADDLDKRNSEPADAPPIDLTNMGEVDMSMIARPELIIRPELSVIASPRIVETPEGLAGFWVQYIKDAKGRRCTVLENDFMTMPDGRTLYLNPMPAEPSNLDVVELGRWSAESRTEWLEGREAPSTSEVLNMVASRIDRYVCLPDELKRGHGITLSLWVMMTYLYRGLPAVPYVYLSGPLGSGKSRCMDVMGRMAWRPIPSSSMTAPTLFRGRHATGGVLLLDEAERMREDSPEVAELRSMLLAGYRNGGQARRLEPIGDTYRMVTFDVFGPTVLGCIKGLPPALSSRCITVKMMRAPKGDIRAKRTLDDSPEIARKVLDALHCWALEYGHDIASDDVPDVGLSNRDAEVWGPLLQIAQHTGDDELFEFFAEHARNASDSNSEDRAPDADPIFVLALYQLRLESKQPEPAEVLNRARTIEDGYFDSWSARGLSAVLKNYGIKASKINGRRSYRTEIRFLESVAERYGFNLSEGTDEF